METLLLVAVVLLALSSSSLTRGQRIVKIPPPRPLCASQYALANYACSRLPINTVPPPSPISPPPPPISPPPPDHHDHHDHDHDHEDEDDHDHDHDHDDRDHNDNDHDHNDHDHNDHDHDHDDSDHDHNDHDHHNNNDNSHDHSRRHHHGHHHHHHHRHREETYEQQECCKWLKQMDNECVCELLVMLPPFLAKPAHNYGVFVDESCIISYTCGGRLIG